MKFVFFRWISLFVSLIFCFIVVIGNLYKDNVVIFLKKNIVAAYNGSYMLITDIPKKIDVDTSITNWASNIILQKRLKKMLTTDKISKIDYMASIYKTNLYMYSYLNQILESDDIKKINLSDEELFEYYMNNSNLFNLEDDIVKYIYIVIPSKFVKNVQNINIQSKEDMNVFCNKYSSLQKEKTIKEDWCSIKELNGIAIQFFKKLKINTKSLYIVKDKVYSHYLYIYDMKQKGNPAPFNMIKSRIVEQIIKEKIIKLKTELENEARKSLKESGHLIKYTNRVKG